jgi:hypothetical protein
MLAAWRRIRPLVLTGLLLLNLANAIANGGRRNWIVVAIVAIVLALSLWRQRSREW